VIESTGSSLQHFVYQNPTKFETFLLGLLEAVESKKDFQHKSLEYSTQACNYFLSLFQALGDEAC
jgi:hypothetical protein